MRNKFSIVVLKVLKLWPIGIAFALLFSGFKDANWYMSAAGGLVIAAGFVFWNVFEYDKYDSMKVEDYLESKHSIVLPNNKAVLEMIESQTKGAFADVILTDKKDEQGYWLYYIETSRFPSFMRVDFSSDKIVLTIKPKYLSFMPDLAMNYRIVNRLRKAGKKLTTTPSDRI